MQHDYNQEALALHKEHRGKIGIAKKVLRKNFTTFVQKISNNFEV